MEPQIGSILEGKVTGITKFGAFVTLESGRSGLVHISEIANTFVNDVREHLQEGQSVQVRVMSAENGKLNLSIKRVQERPRPVNGPAVRSAGRTPREPLPPTAEQAFEDKLKHFLSSSEGKMADLHRSIDGKRGGGRRRK